MNVTHDECGAAAEFTDKLYSRGVKFILARGPQDENRVGVILLLVLLGVCFSRSHFNKLNK